MIIFVNSLSSKDIYLSAKSGDKIALKTFQISSEIFGLFLANLVAITHPEAFFIFGGVAKSYDLLIPAAKDFMNKNVLRNFRHTVEIFPSGLNENDAAILGAAGLVMLKKYFQKKFAIINK